MAFSPASVARWVSPLGAQAAFFAAMVASLPPSGVSPLAWTTLYVGALAVAVLAMRHITLPLKAALGWGLQSVLLALIFFGANGGLDALHGAHRPKAEVARYLGGLELWFVLCPGAASVALALAVAAISRGGPGRAGSSRA